MIQIQLQRFFTVFKLLEIWVVALPAMVALLLVAHQSAARYLHPAWLVDWAEEIIVYLIMWSVFVSLGVTSAQGTHIRTELLVNKLPEKWRVYLEIAVGVLASLFVLWLAYFGWEVAFQAYTYDDRTSSSLRFPIWIYYAILPIGCVSMFVGFVTYLTKLFLSRLP